jgi:carboxypeptidase C (cathepsin A)
MILEYVKRYNLMIIFDIASKFAVFPSPRLSVVPFHFNYAHHLISPSLSIQPGCSSLEGGFSESGLYRVLEYTNPPTVGINPYSWNNFTNNLFIEAPTAVGFSYCDQASQCQHTDTSTAQDNLQTLLSFFAAFPEYKNNNFWITGESYAGIYIPSLAYDIYNYNLANPGNKINLKGIAVGNGCIGNSAGHCGYDPSGINDYHDIQIWRGHGLVSETNYDDIMGNCTWDNESQLCNDLLNQAADAIGNIDVYYLYNTCDDPALARKLRAPVGNSRLGRAIKKIQERAKAAGLTLDPNCFGSGPTLENYFNLPAVKAAFHVATGITWELCTGNNTFGYNSDIADERTTIYPTLTKQAGYQVLIYNGEADLCVPYTDNEWWTRSMGYPVLSDWQAWTVNGQEGTYIGGYRIQYANNFTFATVRGGGHMVPEIRPEAALAMIKAFLSTGTVN